MTRRRQASNVVFLDLIMNALLSFVALFILAFIQMNPKAQEEPVIETEGKFAVIMSWEDGSTADVDLYVRDPLGNVAFYGRRDAGLMHLEHDDLGSRSDRISTESGDIELDRNQERVILRGTVPGEYVVNVHLYNMRDSGGANVTVRLHRLRGRDSMLAERVRELTANGQEQTAFRFTVTADDRVTGVNDLPMPMIGAGRWR